MYETLVLPRFDKLLVSKYHKFINKISCIIIKKLTLTAYFWSQFKMLSNVIIHKPD